MLKKILIESFDALGYVVRKKSKDLPDVQAEKEFMEIYAECSKYTMTSIERMYALYSSVKYVLKNNIPGDFVECGVWRGGSSMLMAFLLHRYDKQWRKIYMYDTYEGMPPPTDVDKSFDKVSAQEQLEKSSLSDPDSVWCYSSFDEVTANIARTGLLSDRIVMVKGKVEDTIPNVVPQSGIAILRLDTDWYESTRHELIHLYPMLVSKGVLIIDDYGHWEGCRKAVDEYFEKVPEGILLTRIDQTGRLGIKIS